MIEKFRDKKIAIVGLGVNNSKLAGFFKSKQIPFEVMDGWKNPDELIGKLDKFDIIFRTPGLPFLSTAVQQALKAGVEISSQTKLFFELCPVPIIGVTGTKGKGTTSSLIANILTAAGKKVWLGGNIGKDPFEFLDQILQGSTLKEEIFVVLELSSFQLQDLTQSPHVAVVLNITSDHLNHHQSVDEYIKAKSTILAFQTQNDFAILHPALPEWFKNLGQAQKTFFQVKEAAGFQTKLLGEHNLENIAAASAVGKVLNISEDVIKNAIAEFEPLDHRLKIIRVVEGITYIDDTFSTNIDPTIAAITAIEYPIILIVGGSEKGLDFAPLAQAIKKSEHVKAIIAIGEVAEKIVETSRGFKGQILTGAKNIDEILRQARSVAEKGDAILFSPATASFGIFKKESDRGNQFVEAVSKL